MEKRVPHEQLCGIFQYYENRTENISKKQHRKTCLCRNQCLASGDMDHQPFLMAEPLFSGNFPFSTLIAVSVVFAIYGTHGNMAFKVPWMLLIAAFPIFGLCVFLLFGRSNLTRSMKKCYELIDEELFPFLNGDDEVIKELQEKDLSIANQSDYIWKYGHYPVYHNTDVAFYADASQGLEAQLAELKKQNILFLWSTMQSSRRNRLSGF